MTILIVFIVSASLLVGAAWGLYGRLPERLEGFLVALAGGALMISAILELIEPAVNKNSILIAFAMVLLGALVFSVLDYWVDEKWDSKGGGLLVAITLDGLPENLALGVSLIGASPLSVAALACSIILSNVPEAASGAKGMVEGNLSKQQVLMIWAATAGLLFAVALLGNHFLAQVPEATLNYIRCFAGGAVVASLALEVFPKAYQKDAHLAGLATAIGLIMTFGLNTLG